MSYAKKDMLLNREGKSVDIIIISFCKTIVSFSFIFEFLSSAAITSSTYATLIKQCDMAINYLTTSGQKVFKTGGHVQKLLDAIKVNRKRKHATNV